jgi:hypothetical protein
MLIVEGPHGQSLHFFEAPLMGVMLDNHPLFGGDMGVVSVGAMRNNVGNQLASLIRDPFELYR